MAHNNDNNHMYIIMKHCNEFLERQDDYRTPKTVKVWMKASKIF